MLVNCYLNMQDVLLPGCMCKCLCNVHVGLVHPWCRLEHFLVINKRPASNIQPHGKTDTAEMHEHERNNAQRALNAHVWYHWLSNNNTRKPMASTTDVSNYLIFKYHSNYIQIIYSYCSFLFSVKSRLLFLLKFCQKPMSNFMYILIWS